MQRHALNARAILVAAVLACGAGVSGCATQHLSPIDRELLCREFQPKDATLHATPDEAVRVRASLKSWRAMQRENVVFQRMDYSCGSAALATMFQYYFEDNITEKDVLKKIFEQLLKSEDPRKELKDRIENGFSMLDLLNVAKEFGYLAAVVRIPLEKLAESKAPVIVKITKLKYEHFVVFRGVHDQTVYLADSVRGNVRLSTQEFLEQWSGESLFLGKPGFGLPEDHPLAMRVIGPARPELEVARQAMFPLR
jgi:predicted double-glycine peptidase